MNNCNLSLSLSPSLSLSLSLHLCICTCYIYVYTCCIHVHIMHAVNVLRYMHIRYAYSQKGSYMCLQMNFNDALVSRLVGERELHTANTNDNDNTHMTMHYGHMCVQFNTTVPAVCMFAFRAVRAAVICRPYLKT